MKLKATVQNFKFGRPHSTQLSELEQSLITLYSSFTELCGKKKRSENSNLNIVSLENPYVYVKKRFLLKLAPLSPTAKLNEGGGKMRLVSLDKTF